MRLPLMTLILICMGMPHAQAAPQATSQEAESSSLSTESVETTLASQQINDEPQPGNMRLVSKASILVGSFTVFLLAVFVGFEVITKVPPTLHTPLMSGSNAISGITVVGAILTAGHAAGGFGSFVGMVAVVLAMINVVGGFLVTRRMLLMFKKR